MPGKNTFANKFSNFWFRVETGIRLDDTQSGFRLYPVRRMKGMRFATRRYEFEVEVLVRAAWRGIEVRNIPVRVFYPEKAERVCRAAGLTTALTDAIAISMADRPGGFADVMETVAEAQISVEYMYAFLTPADDDRACIIMCTSDGERAVRLLREKGITILSGDEIYTL